MGALDVQTCKAFGCGSRGCVVWLSYAGAAAGPELPACVGRRDVRERTVDRRGCFGQKRQIDNLRFYGPELHLLSLRVESIATVRGCRAAGALDSNGLPETGFAGQGRRVARGAGWPGIDA